MERLCDLRAAGVSIWLDTLSRHLVAAGEFGSLVDDSCVTGATSNPTIFAAAIRGADGYDQQLQALLGTGSATPRRSSSWPSTTFATPPTSCEASTTSRAAAAVLCLSNARPISPTAPNPTPSANALGFSAGLGRAPLPAFSPRDHDGKRSTHEER